MNIQLSLKSEKFTETLKDPNSEAHKQLRKKAIDAVSAPVYTECDNKGQIFMSNFQIALYMKVAS